MSELRWAQRARRDLLEIGRYIAKDDPVAARSWVTQLRRHSASAAQLPKAGRMVPEFGREDVREVLVRTYRIVYRILDNAILVLTVFEGHRLLPSMIVDRER